MDFDLSDTQTELSQLATTIAEQATSPQQCAAAESAESRIDGGFWDALGQTGLRDVVTPEAHGGLGLGVVEAALVAEGLGRAVALTPWREHMVAAWVLAQHGGAELQERWLGGTDTVSGVLTTALESAVGDGGGAVQAARGAAGWTLRGTANHVAWTDIADRILVAVSIDGGVSALAIVSPDASGVSLRYGESTTHELQASITFDDAEVADEDLLIGSAIVDDALQFARVLVAAEVVGACERAIELTVEHGNAREQFNKPLSANQAYAQRLADAAITLDAIRVTARQAAWRLGTGRDAAEAVLVAAWWASDGGLRIVRATQHLHGGMGADISYPVHRHFLAVRQRAITLGSSSAHLARLGAAIARGDTT